MASEYGRTWPQLRRKCDFCACAVETGERPEETLRCPIDALEAAGGLEPAGGLRWFG
jgi:hypothetical protein